MSSTTRTPWSMLACLVLSGAGQGEAPRDASAPFLRNPPDISRASQPFPSFPSFAPRYFPDSTVFNLGFRETLSLADVDGDGDTDYFSGNGRGGKEHWFENRGGGVFHPHLVSDSNDADVGAAAADVDGDGDVDRLAGGFVYLNPGNPREAPFRTVATGAPAFTHDLLAGDLDGDGRPDIAVIDVDGIRWFRNPGPPYAAWPAGEVSVRDSVQEHGGLALGDADGDGDLDIFRIDRWFENRDSGKTWIRRPGPDFGNPKGDWGLTARAMARDIDMDGDLDLLQAECDVPNGRVAWFENRERGGAWVMHLIKDSTDHQDFHSLDLADFDGDGDADVMAAGAMESEGSKHWYVWENLDGKGGAFREHMIWRDAFYGGHEAVAFDVDGDGDLDILGKEFSWYHVWLENDRVPGTSLKPRSGMGRPGRPSGKAGGGPWLRADPEGGAGGLFDALGRPPR